MTVRVEWKLVFDSIRDYIEFKELIESLRVIDLDINKILKEETIKIERGVDSE